MSRRKASLKLVDCKSDAIPCLACGSSSIKFAAKRVGSLKTVGQVCSEMAKVYRQCRRHELDLKEGRGLVDMLKAIREALEVSEFERRIHNLEEHDKIAESPSLTLT